MNKEEITKEDILNVTGSVFDTMLDYVDNSNKELEELQQENKQLKERIIKVLELLIDSYITMGEFKAYYKLLTNKDYEAKKSFEYNIDILKGESNE